MFILPLRVIVMQGRAGLKNFMGLKTINMEKIRCVVERITFENPDNGFCVLKCRVKNHKELVCVVGTLSGVHVGSVLSLGGRWKMDPKFGRQFSADTMEETLPATVYGIEKYLGSGLIKGIGPKYAKKIVQYFGKDTLAVIEDTPEDLLKVEGIGTRRVNRIKEGWQEQKEIKNIMLFLQSHGVSTAHATKIYKTYGNESISVVKENPYQLADDIRGIGFRTADLIGEKMGFGKERFTRLRSGILYTLNKLAQEGHCFATKDLLLKKGQALLEVGEDVLIFTLDEMLRVKDVLTEELPDRQAIYLPPFFFSERGIALRLETIQKEPLGLPREVPAGDFGEWIREKTGMDYDAMQLEAIQGAFTAKVMVLTGGPGTGKTTTTLGIIQALQAQGARILLAAPTGRAAKRLSESTGQEAKTIHRLLEVKMPQGYQRNEDCPLEGDVLVVDECSMIDILLMYHLLKAVPDTMQLILVGDVDQLPSVGPGNVLGDLIASGVLPVFHLKKIFRQAQTSRIIMNAHRINAGKMPDLSNGRDTDFFFMEREDRDGVLGAVTELVHKKLPGYYRVPPSSIQVLTPMQRGEVGAANLNIRLQSILNPSDVSLQYSGSIFRRNDKVMQIKNNYDKEVFNGDIGRIVRVDKEDRMLWVDFDGKEVEYDISQLDELVLAYAATIHKSQGSEYPIVVMPVVMSHYVMLQRNLIYTGVTRAKKICILVGSRQALHYAVQNQRVDKRNTLLKERLRGDISNRSPGALS